MFGALLFGRNKKPLKGFKVTGIDRDKKYGIAADSLKMLKEKAAEKFKVFSICFCIENSSFPQQKFVLLLTFFQMKNCKIYLAKDGTEVQDEIYFDSIEPQTLFVAAAPDAIVKTGE